METPFGWHEADEQEVKDVFNTLRSFETMTWSEIVGKNSHLIPTSALCSDAKSCPEIIDVAEVMSLRVASAKRIFGIMDGAVCTIIWWDPRHAVYPMNIANN